MSKYQSATHVTFNIGYHVVFCPKYRYKLLRYHAADELKRLLSVKATDLGVTIHTMEVMPDHVHLLVQGLPSLSIDHIVKQLKGHPSYRLLKQFQYLRHYTSLWTRSYFVEIVGHISEKTVVRYIESQESNAF